MAPLLLALPFGDAVALITATRPHRSLYRPDRTLRPKAVRPGHRHERPESDQPIDLPASTLELSLGGYGEFGHTGTFVSQRQYAEPCDGLVCCPL